MAASLRERLELDVQKIIETVAALGRRIEERFSGSGLRGGVCASLWWVARQASEQLGGIRRPIVALRVGVGALLALIGAGLAATFASLELPHRGTGGLDGMSLVEFVQVLEAGINDVVLIGAAVFFLVTVESPRIKRRRRLDALYELRTIAHVIDMHQLTKDPERAFAKLQRTATSPRVAMTPELLGRYLDYCTEMLSLTGKIAGLRVRVLPRPPRCAATGSTVLSMGHPRTPTVPSRRHARH